MALELNDSIFDEKVLKSDMPVLVDFWAEWCGPCKMVGPIMDELSKDFEGKAVVGKIDVDANQEFAAKYGVRNIPTVLLFKDRELVSRQVGVAACHAGGRGFESRPDRKTKNPLFGGFLFFNPLKFIY